MGYYIIYNNTYEVAVVFSQSIKGIFLGSMVFTYCLGIFLINIVISIINLIVLTNISNILSIRIINTME